MFFRLLFFLFNISSNNFHPGFGFKAMCLEKLFTLKFLINAFNKRPHMDSPLRDSRIRFTLGRYSHVQINLRQFYFSKVMWAEH
jgi:hypothetical protein